MKKQTSFADMTYPARRKPTRRERFQTDLDRLVPWSVFVALIEAHYYRGEPGSSPVGLELMLCMYLCQNCMGLSDEGAEGTIVGATLVAAPPSTRNTEGKCDANIHQTKRGCQWSSA